jgi:hypothetical protein
MFEIFASIGVVGVIILTVGFGLIFWLAKVIDSRDDWSDDE